MQICTSPWSDDEPPTTPLLACCCACHNVPVLEIYFCISALDVVSFVTKCQCKLSRSVAHAAVIFLRISLSELYIKNCRRLSRVALWIYGPVIIASLVYGYLSRCLRVSPRTAHKSPETRLLWRNYTQWEICVKETFTINHNVLNDSLVYSLWYSL